MLIRYSAILYFIRFSAILTLSECQIKWIYLSKGYFTCPHAATPHLLLTASQLGQLLVSTRKRHKLTQAAVANRVGLSQNRISYLEGHADEISVKQLLSWCAVT